MIFCTQTAVHKGMARLVPACCHNACARLLPPCAPVFKHSIIHNAMHNARTRLLPPIKTNTVTDDQPGRPIEKTK